MSTKCRLLLLLLCLAWVPASLGAMEVSSAEDAALRVAATQHEIIAILIEQGEFDRVLPEFEKILALGFSGEQEQLVVKEVWVIVNGLMAARRYDLGHQVIDSALRRLHGDESEFQLLMLKGKLYRQQGLVHEAVRTYRQAQRVRD